MNRDSLGHILTQEQKEYFKDTKIVDNEGNLLVCYHGTKTPGFTEFNHEEDKSQFGNYKFDKHNVNFFATNKEVARGYTEIGIEDNGNIYYCYLNVINPYIVDNKTEENVENFISKRWNNIKDNTIRDRQVRLFKNFWHKWGNKVLKESDLDKINFDLKPFNYRIVSSMEREGSDNGYGRDQDYYDVITLGENTMFGQKHIVMYSYTLDEIMDEYNYEEWRDNLVGNIDEYEDDYYLTTNDVIRFVLWMNEHEGTDYDGIIIPDIYDIGPTGDLFGEKTTDIITLKDSSQIKRITNEKPTNSKNINEKIKDEIINEKLLNERYNISESFKRLICNIIYNYFSTCKVKLTGCPEERFRAGLRPQFLKVYRDLYNWSTKGYCDEMRFFIIEENDYNYYDWDDIRRFKDKMLKEVEKCCKEFGLKIYCADITTHALGGFESSPMYSSYNLTLDIDIPTIYREIKISELKDEIIGEKLNSDNIVLKNNIYTRQLKTGERIKFLMENKDIFIYKDMLGNEILKDPSKFDGYYYIGIYDINNKDVKVGEIFRYFIGTDFLSIKKDSIPDEIIGESIKYIKPYPYANTPRDHLLDKYRLVSPEISTYEGIKEYCIKHNYFLKVIHQDSDYLDCDILDNRQVKRIGWWKKEGNDSDGEIECVKSNLEYFKDLVPELYNDVTIGEGKKL